MMRQDEVTLRFRNMGEGDVFVLILNVLWSGIWMVIINCMKYILPCFYRVGREMRWKIM